MIVNNSTVEESSATEEVAAPPASRKDIPWVWIALAVVVIALIGWWAQRGDGSPEDTATVKMASPYQASKPQRFHLKEVNSHPPFKPEKAPEVVKTTPALPKAQPSAAVGASQDMAALQRTVEAQQKQIEALSESVNTFKQKLDEQEGKAQNVSAMFQQYTLLKNKINASEAFSPELKTFLEFTDVPEAVREKLSYFKPYSAKGIPSMDQLKLNFDRSIRAFYRDGMITSYEREGQGFWADAGRWMRSLVIIRKVGNSHHDDTDGAIIARAEGHVAQNDVTLALDEVQRLSIHALPYFKEWRYDAYAYAGSQKILQDVDMLLFTAH